MHLPALIQDLAVILGVAAVITFIFRRIKQPVVLGYIVAGIIVGPYTPDVFSVTDNSSLKVWAELGVIFLMFNLGLEFSFRRLASVGMSAGITATIQIITMLLLGVGTARVLGWSRMDAAFFGCMIAVSSTTIIIKALEELGLKSKRFAELVFGILIVEDLAAILMLVALTNIATTSEVGGLQLLMAGGKLAIVVGAWFVVGMFIVPRSVKSVSRHGNDEMLTVVAISLCLALVALAAHFHYSVALGAFIMGSILAESTEVKRIEHLVQPLRDIFGAVFFVSVGMLLNPHTILDNMGAVALVSAVIIVGKLLSVTMGALLTGQTVKNSVQTGFSMAQVGEFSFIIASLGLTYKVIDERLYPIIVASSLITTFTTPYLIKSSANIANRIEGAIPPRTRQYIENYIAWFQTRSVPSDRRKQMTRTIVQWILNSIVVISFFTIAASRLMPFIGQYIQEGYTARTLGWIVAFVFSAPSIWAMLVIDRDDAKAENAPSRFLKGSTQFIARVLTVALVGLLSVSFFPALITLAITFAVFSVIFIVFKRRIEEYYRWMETQFRSGFQADGEGATNGQPLHRLAPWDAHLVEVRVPARSFVVGHTLLDLQLREKYGLNVVIIVRDGENIVAPMATETIYPSDALLCFATDAEIERFREDLDATSEPLATIQEDAESYELRRFKIAAGTRFDGVSIRGSGIRERFNCMVVGLERDGQRIRSPHSLMPLQEHDVLWIVGHRKHLQILADEIQTPKNAEMETDLSTQLREPAKT